MRAVRFFFLGVMMMTLVLAKAPMGTGQYEEKVVNYVALGDSIASGYGLENVEEQSYVGQVAQAVENKYGAVKVHNLGENGLRSEQLLAILEGRSKEQHQQYMDAIREADLITLSIGSNDLLQFISVKTDFNELREHGDEWLRGACEKFKNNFPKILEIIQKEAPQAQVFVNNVYNPCKDVSYGLPKEMVQNLEELAGRYIDDINMGFCGQQVQEVFANQNTGKREKKYRLVDVNEAFCCSRERLINMVFSWGEIDPHPNAAGHKTIAKLIIPYISV